MSRKFQITGALTAGVAVLLGAFGAHALKEVLTPDRLEVYHTGVRYLMIHAIALLLTGWFARHDSGRALRVAGWSFIAGMIAFSGSLIALALSGLTVLGATAPVGGLAFITGWIALTLAFARSESLN